MAFSVPNEGETRMLTKITVNDISLRLFNADITPAESDVAATYTGDEPASAGYAAITLTGGSWTVATNSGESTAEYAAQTFTFTSGPETIYGYFLLDTGSGELLLAESFTTGSVSVPGGGGDIEITPIINLA